MQGYAVLQFFANNQIPCPDKGFLRGVQRELHLCAGWQTLSSGFPVAPASAAPHGFKGATLALGVILYHAAPAGTADDSVLEGQLRRGHRFPSLAALYLQLRQGPDLFGDDERDAILQIILGQLALVGDGFVRDGVNIECLLKQAVPHVFLVGQHIHHGAVEPHIIAPPGGDAVSIQPFGNLLVVQAIQKLGVYAPDDFRLRFTYCQCPAVLAIAIEVDHCKALHAPLLISAPFAPFDVLGHILRFGLCKCRHEGQHQFSLRRAGMEMFLLEIDINAQAP